MSATTTDILEIEKPCRRVKWAYHQLKGLAEEFVLDIADLSSRTYNDQLGLGTSISFRLPKDVRSKIKPLCRPLGMDYQEVRDVFLQDLQEALSKRFSGEVKVTQGWWKVRVSR